ncbi:hypothetical protein ACLBYG_21840 [Methylobacterium sp. D53M]
MTMFTVYIDRDENRKVTVQAATAAHAREYATGRYGKVTKIKAGGGGTPLRLTPTLLAALRLRSEGIGIQKKKARKLLALGLINFVGKLTDEGRAALATSEI